MRADALAQTLVARRWTQVLLLTGPSDADAARSATVQAAIKRYGLKLAASKPFKLTADPRERDLANPLLLTQGSYDVVWVVDSDGEFALTLPYRTALPRPVVGDAGLVAVAWSPALRTLRRAAGHAPAGQGRGPADGRARLGGVDGRQGAGRGSGGCAQGAGGGFPQGAGRSRARRLQGRDR